MAIDYDKNSCDTLKLNFNFPVWYKDIYNISGKEILDFCKIKKGELDILDGSPPCQGFSLSGKRKISDKRNELYQEYIRLIKELEPKVFVMENVAGMIAGKMKGKFKEIMIEIKKLNYNIKCKLLNAVNYEVPQIRKRLIFIGVNKKYNISPIYPKKTNKIITVKDSIKGLKSKTCIYLEKKWHTYKLYDLIIPGKNLATCTNKTSGFSFVKIDPNKPANTIMKSLEIGNKKWGAYVHWKEKRTLSIEEIKRISSFPDNYKFTGSIKEQWARIGNCVPPKMIYYIAKTIKENILNKIHNP